MVQGEIGTCLEICGKVGTEATSLVLHTAHAFSNKTEEAYTTCRSLLPQGQLHQCELGLGLGWQIPHRHCASPSPGIDPKKGKSSLVEEEETDWGSHSPEFHPQLPPFVAV